MTGGVASWSGGRGRVTPKSRDERGKGGRWVDENREHGGMDSVPNASEARSHAVKNSEEEESNGRNQRRREGREAPSEGTVTRSHR